LVIFIKWPEMSVYPTLHEVIDNETNLRNATVTLIESEASTPVELFYGGFEYNLESNNGFLVYRVKYNYRYALENSGLYFQEAEAVK